MALRPIRAFPSEARDELDDFAHVVWRNAGAARYDSGSTSGHPVFSRVNEETVGFGGRAGTTHAFDSDGGGSPVGGTTFSFFLDIEVPPSFLGWSQLAVAISERVIDFPGNDTITMTFRVYSPTAPGSVLLSDSRAVSSVVVSPGETTFNQLAFTITDLGTTFQAGDVLKLEYEVDISAGSGDDYVLEFTDLQINWLGVEDVITFTPVTVVANKPSMKVIENCTFR